MAAHHWGRLPSEFFALPVEDQEWMEASFVAAVAPRTKAERDRAELDALAKSNTSRKRPSRPAR